MARVPTEDLFLDDEPTEPGLPASAVSGADAPAPWDEVEEKVLELKKPDDDLGKKIVAAAKDNDDRQYDLQVRKEKNELKNIEQALQLIDENLARLPNQDPVHAALDAEHRWQAAQEEYGRIVEKEEWGSDALKAALKRTADLEQDRKAAFLDVMPAEIFERRDQLLNHREAAERRVRAAKIDKERAEKSRSHRETSDARRKVDIADLRANEPASPDTDGRRGSYKEDAEKRLAWGDRIIPLLKGGNPYIQAEETLPESWREEIELPSDALLLAASEEERERARQAMLAVLDELEKRTSAQMAAAGAGWDADFFQSWLTAIQKISDVVTGASIVERLRDRRYVKNLEAERTSLQEALKHLKESRTIGPEKAVGAIRKIARKLFRLK